jgi:chromosome segregation ATPase
MLSNKFIYNVKVDKKNREILNLEKEITNKNLAISQKMDNKTLNQTAAQIEIKELEKQLQAQNKSQNTLQTQNQELKDKIQSLQSTISRLNE